jgi:hypothetical protein
MGLDQYLQADYYFSDTWDNTADKATQIISICGMPDDLPLMRQVSVRVTLLHWRNEYWLEDYILSTAQADADAGEAYIDTEILSTFKCDVERVLNNPDLIEQVFPNPSWYYKFPHNNPRRVDDDLITLKQTYTRLVEILDKLPNADFFYKSSC